MPFWGKVIKDNPMIFVSNNELSKVSAKPKSMHHLGKKKKRNIFPTHSFPKQLVILSKY